MDHRWLFRGFGNTVPLFSAFVLLSALFSRIDLPGFFPLVFFGDFDDNGICLSGIRPTITIPPFIFNTSSLVHGRAIRSTRSRQAEKFPIFLLLFLAKRTRPNHDLDHEHQLVLHPSGEGANTLRATAGSSVNDVNNTGQFSTFLAGIPDPSHPNASDAQDLAIGEGAIGWDSSAVTGSRRALGSMLIVGPETKGPADTATPEPEGVPVTATDETGRSYVLISSLAKNSIRGLIRGTALFILPAQPVLVLP